MSCIPIYIYIYLYIYIYTKYNIYIYMHVCMYPMYYPINFRKMMTSGDHAAHHCGESCADWPRHCFGDEK